LDHVWDGIVCEIDTGMIEFLYFRLIVIKKLIDLQS